MKRSIRLAVVTLLLVAFVWLLDAFWVDHTKDKAFDATQYGTPQSFVIKAFGIPSEITGPPLNVAWVTDASIKTNTGECVCEFRYHPRLTLCGTEWLIGFDAQSNTVSKYQMSSP